MSCTSSFAQDASTGALRGTIVDSTGGRIAGAVVALVNDATGSRSSTVSDSSGQFIFQLLSPGDYSGRATAPGMSPEVTPRLHVAVGGTTAVEFRLTVAGVRETVTVTGQPPLVDTQPTAISSLIDKRAIDELPLDGRRFTDLALLTPGVTQDPRGMTSGSNGDLAFGGIRGYQSSYLVDGTDDNNAFFSQARGRYRAPYQFSNEVVQEFRVSSNTYGVELGRAGGAVINVVTKSGSNQLHGKFFLLSGQRIRRNSSLSRFQASRSAAAIRIHSGRTHSPQQGFLFRRLRPAYFSRANRHALPEWNLGGDATTASRTGITWRL